MALIPSPIPAATRHQLVYAPHPVSAAINRQVINVPFLMGESVAGYIERVGLVVRQPVALQLNDVRVLPEQWPHTYPQHGDIITLRGVAQGGGDEGSDPMRTILTLAVLMAAPQVGAWGGIMSGGAVAPFAGQALFAIGGMLLVNALVPPPEAPDFSDATSPTYSLSGSANRARINQPLPLVCGIHRMFADHGAKPYTDFQGDEQYLYQVFVFGLSDIILSDFKIGDTALASYTDVQSEESSGSTGVLTLFPADVDAIAGADINTDGSWIERTSSINSVGLAVDISGLVYYTNHHGLLPLRVTLAVEYRATGSGTWLPLDTWVIENSDRTPVRQSKKYTVAQGQYDVRIRFTLAQAVFRVTRTSPPEEPSRPGYYYYTVVPDGSSTVVILSWSSLRSYQPDTSVYAGQKRVALKIKATGQLQGQVAEFNALVSARCLVWTGSAWVTQATSNPAWWYLWFARGQYNAAGQRLFGAGLADAYIDIAAIQSWATWCTSKGLTFNAVLDQKQSCFAVLQAIARCGRAAPTRASGKLGVIWDADSQPPVAVFGMSNIIRNSFNVRYLTGQLADEVVVNFVNASNDYQPDTVRASVPGVAAPMNPVTVDLFGCTNAVMAGREANLTAAEQLYRRRQITWDADMEGMVCQRGDVVQLSHDLTQWGKSGRLVAGTTTQLTLDRDVTFTPATDHFVMVRYPNGSFDVYAVNYQAGPSAIITLADPLPSAPDTDPDHPPMDYVWFFDVLATPGKLVKITDIRPQSLHRVQISATDEDPAYYLSEFNSYTYVAPSVIGVRLPTISNVAVNDTLILAGSVFAVRVGVAWDVTGEYGSATVRAATSGQPLREVGKTYGRRFEFAWQQTTGDIDIEIILVNLSGQYGAASRSIITYTIKGKDALPSDVLNFSARQMGDAALLRWDAVPDVDLKGFSVRYGPRGNSSWANGTPLSTVLAGTNVTTVALPPGDWTLYIKATDTNENESLNAASDDLVFDNTYNLIAQVQQAPDWLRQNWVPWSEDFSNVAWNKNQVSVEGKNKIVCGGGADPFIYRSIDTGLSLGGRTFTWAVELYTDTGQPTEAQLFLYDNTLDSIASKVVVLTTTPALYFITHTFPLAETDTVVVFRVDLINGPVAGDYLYANKAQFTETNFVPDYIKTEASANNTGGHSVNFVKHHTGVLVPSSTAINASIGWRTFDEFVPDPATLCSYTAPEIDIGFNDTVRVWGDIESALGPGETGIADPQLYVDYRLAGQAMNGFEPWAVGNVLARHVQHKLELDTAVGVAYISGFRPTVDLLEWVQQLPSITVAAGGSTIVFAQPFHVAPFLLGASALTGGALFVEITAITATQFVINIYNTSNVSVGGTARAAFSGA